MHKILYYSRISIVCFQFVNNDSAISFLDTFNSIVSNANLGTLKIIKKHYVAETVELLREIFMVNKSCGTSYPK